MEKYKDIYGGEERRRERERERGGEKNEIEKKEGSRRQSKPAADNGRI